MKSKIFIVVLVTYDYYRFQDNLYANTNKKDCIKWAKEMIYNNTSLPVILTKKTSELKDDPEITHLWIQEL